jgi:hypothetical protein
VLALRAFSSDARKTHLKAHTPTKPPPTQTKKQNKVHNGSLLVTVRGEQETVPLPEDAFTTHAAASYARHTLTVTMPRRDPEGPAMVRAYAARAGRLLGR